MLGRCAGFLLVLAAAARAPAARADDCLPPSRVSSCFDADRLWLVSAASRLGALDTLEPRAAGSWSLAAASTYLDRPVRLFAPSPDPDGRELLLVKRRTTFELLFEYAPHRRVSAELALGLAWHGGAGTDGALAQRSQYASELVLRDPRLGAAFELGTLRVSSSAEARALLRYRLTLPLGGAFAGARSPVSAPGVALALRWPRLTLASELALRSTSPVELGGARLGSELFAGLGGAYELWPDRLWLGLELWLWPNLLDAERRLDHGVEIEQRADLPAEWSLSSELRVHETLGVRLGFGTGLPLSSERRRAGDGTVQSDDFAAPATPRWRGLLLLRYTHGREPR